MDQSKDLAPPDELDPQEVTAVEQLKQGNINGLEYLVKKFELVAVQAAALVTCDQALAEDVVQETFIKAYNRIHQFQPNQPFRPWFIRSVINAALRNTQVRNRQKLLGPTEIAEIETVKYSNGKSPEEIILEAETNQEVWQALEHLPPKKRAILVQRYFAGLSVKELSLFSGVPSGTIKWRLSEARKKLKGVLLFNRSLAQDPKEKGEW